MMQIETRPSKVGALLTSYRTLHAVAEGPAVEPGAQGDWEGGDLDAFECEGW